MPNILSSELLLLIACCQAHPDPQEIALHIQKVEQKEKIIVLAFRHGLLPLVYQTLRHFQNNSQPLIEEELLSDFKAHYLNISKKNMLMTAELIRIEKIANQENISILPFKGPLLAQIAYQNISLRQFSDLDILIHKKAFQTLAQKMQEKGYTAHYPIHTFKEDKVLFEMNNDCPFYDRKRGLAVEIHWDFFRKLALPTHKFLPWENQQKVSINGFSFHTLSYETHLLYHSLHGAKHVWERLLWIVDIDRFIRAVPSLDWERMLKMSQEMGAQKMFLSGIALAERYFHTPLPETISQHCKEADFDSFFHYIESEFNRNSPTSEESLIKLLKVIHLRDTLYYKVFTALEFLFRPGINERRSIILSNRWFWLYWLIRPLGMSWRFIVCRLMKQCKDPIQQ